MCGIRRSVLCRPETSAQYVCGPVPYMYSNLSIFFIMKQTVQTAPDRPVRTPYTPPCAEVYAIEVERGFASSIEDPDTQEDNNFYDQNA